MVDKSQALIRLAKIKNAVPEDFKPMVETVEDYIKKTKVLQSSHRTSKEFTTDISQRQKVTTPHLNPPSQKQESY